VLFLNGAWQTSRPQEVNAPQSLVWMRQFSLTLPLPLTVPVPATTTATVLLALWLTLRPTVWHNKLCCIAMINLSCACDMTGREVWATQSNAYRMSAWNWLTQIQPHTHTHTHTNRLSLHLPFWVKKKSKLALWTLTIVSVCDVFFPFCPSLYISLSFGKYVCLCIGNSRWGPMNYYVQLFSN